MTRASVLVPIHDKPTTLPLTVDTVLRQSVEDLEVLLIGDGITDDVRSVVEGMVAADPLDPETFFKDNTEKQLEARLEDDLNDIEDHGGSDDDIKADKQVLFDVAERVGVEDPKDYDKGFWGKVGGFFGL